MKTKSTKGQAALETIFIVLFIILAVGGIMTKTINYSNDIGDMANARAIAQGAALKLTIEGTTTHLIRIDDEPAGNHYFKLWVTTSKGKCDAAKTAFETAFSVPLGSFNDPNDWECDDVLF